MAQGKKSSPLSTSGYGDIRVGVMSTLTESPVTDEIQFVNEHPERSTDDDIPDKQPSPFPVSSDTQPGSSLDETPSISRSHDANMKREVVRGPRDVEQTGVDDCMEGREANTPQYPQVSFNDGDESAIRGLLALGTASPERAVLFDNLGISDSNHVLDDRTGDMDCDASTAISPPEICFSKNDDILSQTQVLHLLRHYRYSVAPWVCKRLWYKLSIAS